MSFSSMMGDLDKHLSDQLDKGRFTQAQVAEITMAFVTQAIISSSDETVKSTQISNDFTLKMMEINQKNLESDKRIEEINTKIALMKTNAIDNRIIKVIDSMSSMIGTLGSGGMDIPDRIVYNYFEAIKMLSEFSKMDSLWDKAPAITSIK